MVVRIYILKDPRTGATRYCGKTELEIRDRLRLHLGNTVRHKRRGGQRSPCLLWTDDLIDAGMIPVIEQIDVCAKSDADDVERAWIAKLRLEHDLLNVSAGGRGKSAPATPQAKTKMSEVTKGKWADPVQREKMIAGMRANRATPEYKAKRRANNKTVADQVADYLRQANIGAIMFGDSAVSDEIVKLAGFADRGYGNNKMILDRLDRDGSGQFEKSMVKIPGYNKTVRRFTLTVPM